MLLVAQRCPYLVDCLIDCSMFPDSDDLPASCSERVANYLIALYISAELGVPIP
jgi:hypothetical protein